METRRSIFNWHQIASNAVSTLVAAVLIGAALIVWNAANSMDDKIEAANRDLQQAHDKLRATQIALEGTQAVLSKNLAELGARVEMLESRISPPSSGKAATARIPAPPGRTTQDRAERQRELWELLQRELDVYPLRPQ